MIKNLKKQNVWFVFTPYLWLVLFFFVPLALIFKISISVSEWGMPPYRDLFSLSENESTFIPSAEKHRLENNTDKALRLIEIQTGDRLEETDIERFEDDYGRD